MSKMTITQEQLKQAALIVFCTPLELQIGLEHIGFTIAPAEPPEAMVKLAERFAVEGWRAAQGDPSRAAKIAALAALQHAVDVASSTMRQPCGGEVWVPLADILTALGAA